MIMSIMFGQMGDAHLHMTNCLCFGQTGNMQAGCKWASRQAGIHAYFHGESRKLAKLMVVVNCTQATKTPG